MATFIDRSGERYGRLTVLERAQNDPQGKVVWAVRCDCGTATTVRARLLGDGHTRSCGCLQRDVASTDVPTYQGLHLRIYRARGKASAYACDECGEQARDWSYDGTDSAPLWGTPCSSDIARPYSLDLDRYRPLCKSCHVREGWENRKVG